MVKTKKIRDMALTAMGAVIITLCSLISIPAPIPFTLQTFGLFLVLYNLGGKRGFFSVLVYLALGICGIPVFANFGVGLATLLGPTGGYLFGFVAASGLYWFAESRFGKRFFVKALSLCVGMLTYYAFGLGFYMLWCGAGGGPISVKTAFLVCVAPYVFYDICKLAVVLLRKITYFEKYD